MSSSDSGNYALLDQLAEEFAARYRGGERPSLKEYTDRYPELADDIRDLFPAMVQMEGAEEDRREAEEPSTDDASVPKLEQLGDFRIIREVGKGGMGIVYEAEQVSLGRHVALKVLPKKMLLDAKAKRRFEREAKAAAKLHHTNIVPIFGVGEHDGLPYYVMQFIQGLGLDEVLEELSRMQGKDRPASGTMPEGALQVSRREVSAANMAQALLTGEFHGSADARSSEESHAKTPPTSDTGRLSDSFTVSSSSVTLPGQGADSSRTRIKKLTYWQSVAQIGVQVASALDYAHKQGILHRDIKPSNLLLDLQGTVWVADFGLAKAEDQQNLTHTGDILGTLRYIAPEAFEGKADPRGDVYALGLTLYELLAMKPAFDEKDRNKLIKQVTTGEPQRLERINTAVPRDLVTVVHKAMEREPGQRYPNAGDLGADLQRFIDDEPIHARRIGLRERAWRWCRRNPGIAGLTAASVVLLIGLTGAALLAAGYFNRLASQEAQAANNEKDLRREADMERKATKDNLAKVQAALAKLADSRFEVATFQLDRGQADQAAEILVDAQALREQLLQADPQDAGHHVALAAIAATLSNLHWKAEQLAEAHTAWKLARDHLAKVQHISGNSRELVQLRTALRLVAENYCRAGLVKEAAEQFTAYFKLEPDIRGEYCLQAACASFLSDDAAPYRASCNRMLEQLSDTFFTTWACGLDARGQFASSKLLDMARKGLAGNPNYPPWQHALGLTYYRADQLEEAITLCTASTRSNWVSVCLNYPVLAMAYHRLGKKAEATKYLRLSQEWYQRSPMARQVDSPTVALPGQNVWDWLIFEALYREASLLITQLIPFEETYGRLHRGQLRSRLGENAAAEADFQAAAAMKLNDASLLISRGRLFSQISRHAQAEADFNQAVALNPKTPGPSIERARYLAERGRNPEADADYAKAAALAPDNLHRFLEAGWWVVGPFSDELEIPCSPEANPHPSKPVDGLVDGIGSAAWKSVPIGELGAVDFMPVCKVDHRSAYALTYVYCLKPTTATLLVTADDHVRVWLNGQLVHERYLGSGVPVQRVPLAFRAGKNELLVKVSNDRGPHFMVVRIADNPSDLGNTYADLGLWREAAAQYRKTNLQELPDDPGIWFRHAYAFSQSDEMAYRQICEQMADKWLSGIDFHRVNWVVRACALAPKAVADLAGLIKAIQKVNRLNRSHSGFLFTLATAHYRAGQWDESIQKCTESRQAKKNRGGEYLILTDLLLALAHHGKGQIEKAKEWRQKAEDWFAKQEKALDSAQAIGGPTNMIWENWLTAQALRREAAEVIGGIKMKPESSIRDQLSKFEPATHDYDLALLLVRKGLVNRSRVGPGDIIVQIQPDEARLWLARARRLADLKRLKEADADIAEAVKIEPKDPQVWRERGRIYAGLGQLDNAAHDFAMALEYRPQDPAWLQRVVRYELGRPEILTRVMTLRPNDNELQTLVRGHERYAAWAKAIGGRKLVQKTTEAGGGTGGGPFHHVPGEEPSLLVGFKIWPGYYNRQVIGAVQPIYLSAEGASNGPAYGLHGSPSGPFVSVLAKQGYAVAGITTKKSNLLDGFKVIFLRIDGAGLDAKDRYESEWQGSTFGAEEIVLGGDGRPVIGIHGRSGLVMDALGLVQLEVDAAKRRKQ